MEMSAQTMPRSLAIQREHNLGTITPVHLVHRVVTYNHGAQKDFS